MNRYIPIACHESYKLDLPKGHRFPMEKYKLLPNELINQGISKETDFFSPYPPELNCVTQVHDKEYVLKLKSLKLTKPEINTFFKVIDCINTQSQNTLTQHENDN